MVLLIVRDSTCLLPKSPLKAYNVCSYNVPASYQSVCQKLAMCLLVTKVFLKSLQCVCLLPKCRLKASQMRSHLNTSPNILMLVNKFPVHTLLAYFLIEVTKLNWNNSALFTVLPFKLFVQIPGSFIWCLTRSCLWYNVIALNTRSALLPEAICITGSVVLVNDN